MKGTHQIIVQNKRIRYDFEIRRNLTIIQGDSATGKTTLISMIGEFYENGVASGIELRSDKECSILSGRNWKADLAVMKDNIVFIDEGNEFVFTDEFASVIRDTDNYYVIATREGIPSLPYSIEEIYGIRESGKYGTLKQTYNEFFHLYRADDHQKIVKPKVLVTEDTNSGNQFFKAVAEKSDAVCRSAGGKSNIFAAVMKEIYSLSDEVCPSGGDMNYGMPCGEDYSNKQILVIADGAAFGAEMEKMIRLMEEQNLF